MGTFELFEKDQTRQNPEGLIRIQPRDNRLYIPYYIRKRCGITKTTKFDYTISNDSLYLEPVKYCNDDFDYLNISSNYRVSIPKTIQAELGIDCTTPLLFEIEDRSLENKPNRLIVSPA